MKAYKVFHSRSNQLLGRVETDDKDIPQQFFPVSPGKTMAFDGYLGMAPIGVIREQARWFSFEEIKPDVVAGEIIKTDPAKRLVFGWAYVSKDRDGKQVVDKSGDFVDDVEEIEKAAYKFVLDSRAGDADHTNVKGAEMVESIVFTEDKIEKLGLPVGSLPLGWWVGFKVHDDKTWERVEKGELVMFSVHGSGTRTSVSSEGGSDE